MEVIASALVESWEERECNCLEGDSETTVMTTLCKCTAVPVIKSLSEELLLDSFLF